MLRELADALEMLSAEVAIVLALDDLQWSDDSTATLLAMLGRRTAPSRLFIIGTCRQTDFRSSAFERAVSELTVHRQATTLALDRLGEDAVAEYVEARWPKHASPHLVRTIYEATSGNSLFMVALIDDLEARGMVRRGDAGWQVLATAEEIAAHRPDTVRQLIDARIDPLPTVDQRILEAAAVAGAEFAAGAVAAALELSADEVDSRCEELAAQGRFLRYLGAELWPDGTLQSRYAFVHALFRDAAKSRSSDARMHLWHRRIGERLEAAQAGATETNAAILATHFDAGQSFAKAVHYYDLADRWLAGAPAALRRSRTSERARLSAARRPRQRAAGTARPRRPTGDDRRQCASERSSFPRLRARRSSRGVWATT
jgi:predicted ATPase